MDQQHRILIALCEEQAKEDGDMGRLSADLFSLDSAVFARSVAALQSAGLITGAFITQPTADGEGVWFANLRNAWVTENGVQTASRLLTELADSK